MHMSLSGGGNGRFLSYAHLHSQLLLMASFFQGLLLSPKKYSLIQHKISWQASNGFTIIPSILMLLSFHIRKKGSGLNQMASVVPMWIILRMTQNRMLQERYLNHAISRKRALCLKRMTLLFYGSMERCATGKPGMRAMKGSFF